ERLLCRQPAQVGVGDDAGCMADALSRPAYVGAHEPFGGEQGHLRVVGDGAETAIRRPEVAYAAGTEALQDLPPAVELDGSAQGIAGGTGQQAPAETVAAYRIGAIAQRIEPGHGHLLPLATAHPGRPAYRRLR